MLEIDGLEMRKKLNLRKSTLRWESARRREDWLQNSEKEENKRMWKIQNSKIMRNFQPK